MLRPIGRWAIAPVVALAALATLTTLPEVDASTSCLPREIKARLSQVRAKFGSVTVISTYRRGARMRNGRASFHASCRAVDFKPPRGKYSQVASWLKANHGGGVGTYSCGMHHIHIDNGPRVRFHHCQRADVPEDTSQDTRSAAWPAAGTPGAWPVVLDKEGRAGARL